MNRCTNVIVTAHGLDDPKSDLVIVGHCGDCGQQLFIRRHREKDIMPLSTAEKWQKAQIEAVEDQRKAAQHHCRKDS